MVTQETHLQAHEPQSDKPHPNHGDVWPPRTFTFSHCVIETIQSPLCGGSKGFFTEAVNLIWNDSVRIERQWTWLTKQVSVESGVESLGTYQGVYSWVI